MSLNAIAAPRIFRRGQCLPAAGRRYNESLLAGDSVREAAERIAESIAADILGEGWRRDSGS